MCVSWPVATPPSRNSTEKALGLAAIEAQGSYLQSLSYGVIGLSGWNILAAIGWPLCRLGVGLSVCLPSVTKGKRYNK